MIDEILNKYLNNEKVVKFANYSLESITNLLSHLQNPQKNFKSIHIAGTNGKGSTAFMIAGILEKSGYKTGLYTSPHLIKINERIKINSTDIDDNILCKYIKEIDDIIKNKCSDIPTYFDILTATAFKYFCNESVDIAVIETGLGGRLDSTNVIVPEISIITDISMDHTLLLGDTLEKIAEEKCGIIKTGIPVITSNTNKPVMKIIETYCNEKESELYIYNRDFFAVNVIDSGDNFTFDYLFDECRLPEIKIQLFPRHQIKNTSSALTAINLLRSNNFTDISEEIIYSSLEKLHVPGRFEVLSTDPLIIYDPAHNFDALNNLINGINELFYNKKVIYIISLMSDKADKKTLELFKKIKNKAIYYVLDDARAYIPDNNLFVHIVSDINNIIDILKSVYEDDTVFIFTGTFRIYNSAFQITNLLNKLDNQEKL